MATRPGLSPQPQAAAATAPDTDTTPDVDPYANGTLLYHQTIIPTQGISHAVKGSFTLPGSNDLILVRHNTLELWTLYMGSGSGSSSSAECIHSCPLFVNVLGAAAVPTGLGGGGGGNGGSGTVASTQAAGRAGGSSAASLFASGGSYDYLIVTSETGYATLLRYELAEPPVPTRTSFLSPAEGGASSRGAENDGGGSSSTYVAPSLAGRFVKVSEVCLGRSGARLTVPGARIAVDPNGGAVMVTSLMRHKVVLPFRRTSFGQNTTGQGASALAWLGAGSSQGWGGGSGLLGDDSDDGEDGREDDEDGAGTRGGASSRMKGSQDDEAVGRQLARKRRRLAAPRGVLALGSAIEAHRQTVILSCCALDGFVETSVFAVLEQDTVEAHTQAQAAADQSHDKPRTATGDGANVNAADAAGGLEKDKHEDSTKNKMGKFLVVYAYVPSLQQVQRTHLVRLPPTAHRLVAVPAAPFGPGGVLVCTDTELIWYDLSPGAYAGNNNNNSGNPNGPNGEASTAVFKCFAPLPRRMAFTETLYDPSIIAHAVTCVRKDFFMLLQDEHGDLFRVFLSSADVQRAYDALRAATAATAAGGVPPRVVNPLAVHYFDTIAPVSDMALFPRGFLLAGAETGPFHGLYKIVRDGYMKESEYIVKRVKRVREVPVPTAKEERTSASDALADTKRPREQDDGKADAATTATATDSTDGVKKEEPHDVDDRKPKATGTLLALLRQQAPSAPAPAPVQTITRVIAIYEPHNGLRHLALVQTYPNTPPVVGFTTAIPRAGAGADEKGGKIPAPPPGLLDSAPGKPTASAAASSQPQMQFNLIAGRGAGSVLLNARFGYATRREGRFTLPFAAQSVFPVLSAHALQRLVRELEAAVAQAQALMDTSRAVLSSGTAGLPSSHSATTAAAAKAAKMKTLQKLLATSANRESQLWTDKLLITTSQGTTAPYHVGRTMELDWWTGFATSERTLAVATLKYGAGYVQVTPRGIHVLQPTSKEAREQEKRQGAEVVQTAPTATGSPSSMASSLVQPTTWTHRHGKMILAAAATPTTVLASFAQGGVASFTLGLTGTQLEQSDDLPTFPPCPAVSLLQPSSESLTGAAMDAQLKAFLFDGSGTSSRTASAALSGRAREELELAAVATIAQEVYLMDPRKLREPLERISCKSVGHADSHHGGNEEVRGTLGEDGSVTGSQSGAIVSVLLTYLGGGGNGGGAGGGAAPRTGSSASSAAAQQHQQQQRGRRLFCFIGHMNGTLTRCELDPISAKVIARDELTCGTAPCQVISGDSQTVCYVQSGIHAWRSEVRDGVPKLVPWRFPSRQAAFAYFMRPSLTASPAAATSAPSKSSAVKKEPRGENDMGGHDSDDDDKEAREAEAEAAAQRANGEGEGNGAAASITFLSAAAASMAAGGASAASANLRHECVVALQHNELTLFSAQQSGSGASLLEYSFTAHSLPVAGRRILQHTTRPAYYVILSTEHRGYSMADVKRMRAEREDRVRIGADGVPVGPIPLDAPQRALGFGNVYNSTLQLYHEEGNRVLPRYFFPEGEAVLCGTVGSFVEDFGKEPVLVVGAASHYTHGAGCGGGARWSQGWLCAFRFTTATANAPGATKRLGAAGDALLRIEPLHRTVIRSDPNPKTGGTFAPDYPSAVHLCEDVGLLFVGLGADHGLRVYVWGQQQFLRRCHLPDVPSRIVAIETAWVAPPPGSATADSSNFLSDLYHVPFSRPEAMKKAREQRLLVFCATASHSVLVASLQSSAGSAPGSRNGAPSFLMVVARDAVPRSLTSSLVVLRDGRTLAVADRFGNVTFLRVPLDNRNGFSVPVGDMRDAQLAEAEDFISHEQFLEEVASHATGQVVTALQKQSYDPSNGADAALDIEMVVYSTALGAVGAYVPFVAEADAALAAYAQPLLASSMRTLLAPQTGALPAHLRGHLTSTAGTVPGHHIIEGDLFHAYRHQAVGTTNVAAASSAPTYVTSSIFTAEAKAMVEDDLKRARHVEAARRRVLGLPARELPELSDLIAKQRALASLPQ